MNFKFRLFKTPSHQRFHIEPRYYDPVKEDIENRTSRIKAEMGLKEDDTDVGYRSQIAGSFRKNMKYSSDSGGQAMMLRMIIFVALVLFAGGFVYVGTEIFYLLLLFVPFYLWKRIKR